MREIYTTTSVGKMLGKTGVRIRKEVLQDHFPDVGKCPKCKAYLFTQHDVKRYVKDRGTGKLPDRRKTKTV